MIGLMGGGIECSRKQITDKRITGWESGSSSALQSLPESQRNESVTRKSKRIRQPTALSLEQENNTIEDEDSSFKRRKTTDLSSLFQRYEITAYRKVFQMFLRSGLNESKLELL